MTHSGVMRVDNLVLFRNVVSILQQGKQATLFVRGSSMYPFLRDSCDRVLLKQPHREELVPGAIVLFLYRGRYFLHRIIKEDTFFIMRGDNCVDQYETVGSEDILGIVKGVIRSNGTYIDSTSYKYRFFSWCWTNFPKLSRKLYHYRNSFLRNR